MHRRRGRTVLRRQWPLFSRRGLRYPPLGATARDPRQVLHARPWRLQARAPVRTAGARAGQPEVRPLPGGGLTDRRRETGVPTFEEAAERVIAIHSEGLEAPGERQNVVAGLPTRSRLSRLNPHRRQGIDQVRTADVMAVLLPLFDAQARHGGKLRKRIGTVMKWAVAEGYRNDIPTEDGSPRRCPCVRITCGTCRRFRMARRHRSGEHLVGVGGRGAVLRVHGADSGQAREAPGRSWKEINWPANRLYGAPSPEGRRCRAIPPLSPNRSD